MTRPRRQLVSHSALGFSLIELMVSLTIGLVIAIAAMSAYLGASSSSKMSDSQSRMNEDAQAALNVLAQQIRMAGTNPVQRANPFGHNPVYDKTYVGGAVTAYASGATTTYSVSSGPSAFAIRGCDGTFSNMTATSTTSLDLLATCGTSTLPDSIAVSYEADRYNTVPSGTAPSDCVGSAIPTTVNATFTTGPATTASFSVADNRFYIAPSSGITSLMCKGIGSVAQALVENVEDMQLTYGTVSATSTSTTATVAGYLTAYQLVTDTTSPGLGDLTINERWGKVLSVRICIVVRSESPVVTDAASARYDDCQGNHNVSAPDLRLRRAYSTTVVLRNRRL